MHKFTDIFRLDKYQSMAIMSICLSNIVRLMEDHSVAKHLRQIIIEREVSVEEYEELSSNIFEKSTSFRKNV